MRTSLLAAVVGVHAFQGTRWTVAGEVGRAARATTTRRSRPTASSTAATVPVQIAVGSEGLWQRFCAAFGLDPDAEGLATNAERVAARDRVIEVVEAAFADWDAEPLLARLAEVGVPAGKVRTLDEVYAWDQTASQGLLVEVEHPTLGAAHAARPAAALLRRRRRRGDPPRPRRAAAARRARPTRSAPGSAGRRDGDVDRGPPTSCSTSCSTRAPSSRGTSPSTSAGSPTDYRAQLEAAAAKAGTDESVLTGRGLVRGRPVAVVVNEFRFLAGSIGRAAADRITAAVRRATAEGLPAAGQHGVGRHPHAGGHAGLRADGRDLARADGRTAPPACPTSCTCATRRPAACTPRGARSAHVTVAEPGALVGFLGPKVYEALNGRPFPTGRPDRREPRRQRGHRRRRRRRGPAACSSTGALGVLVDPPDRAAPAIAASRSSRADTCPRGSRSRSPAGPTGRGCASCCATAATGTLRLHGTDEGERDSTMLVALTRLDGQPCVLVGQDRARQSPTTPMGPGALREARRGDAPGRGAGHAARHRHRHPRRRAVAAGRGARDRR